MKQTRKDVKHPCVNCKYFKTCGDNARTMPCEGRELQPKRRSFMSIRRRETIQKGDV